MSNDSSLATPVRILWGVLVALTLFAGTVSAQAVQDGKWKVTSAMGNRGIYANYSGGTQKVLFTVCATAGGTVEVLVSTAPVATLDVGNCTTRTESLPQTSSVTVHLTSGTSVNGNYSITIL